ncbi:cation:proton antiporter [Jatrophihabitans sp.]|uniref:cation:proton antiporter n=1 Tax=Jatrophihabitans sp. TaxID=1932789 RepID=UPI002EFD0252
MPLAAGFAPLPQPAGHDLLVFLIQLGALLALALALGRLAARVGLPAVVGELLTGVLVGPSLLGHLAPGLWHWLFPSSAPQANMINAVAQVGVLLLVGLSGMHVDLGLIRRRGATAVRISLGGLLIPLVLGVSLGTVLPATMRSAGTDRATFACFLGVAMCVSAIPVIAKTLLDMKLLHRDVGQLTLAAGAVDDAVGWCLLSVVSAMAIGGVHGWRIALTVAEILAFLIAAAFIGRPVARALFTLAGRSSDQGPGVAVAVAMIIGGAATTQALGLEPAFGAFVAGMLLSATRVRQVIDPARLAPLRTFVLWVGAPVFLATAGLRMDLASLAHPTVLLSALIVLSVAVLGKFAGAYLGARLSRLSAREGFALGAGMNARGVVEVVVAMAGLRLGVITTSTYTIIVLVAVVTSVMAPPLLRRAMAGLDHNADERIRELEHARWSGTTERASSGPGG